MSQSEMRLALRGPRRPGCDGTGSVSNEFPALLEVPKLLKTMHDLDVDILTLADKLKHFNP